MAMQLGPKANLPEGAAIMLGNNLSKAKISRFRSIVCALLFSLLGGLLRFIGVFIIDMTHHIDIARLAWTPAANVSVPSDIPKPVSDGPGYLWDYSIEGRTLGTPYLSVDASGHYSGIYPNVREAKVFHPAPNQKAHWCQLWYQLLFLNWLQQNGTHAGYVAACTALVVAWAVFMFDHIRQRPKVSKVG